MNSATVPSNAVRVRVVETDPAWTSREMVPVAIRLIETNPAQTPREMAPVSIRLIETGPARKPENLRVRVVETGPADARSAAESERFGIACHEAGHAVAMCILRQPFRSVSVVPDKDTLGRVDACPFDMYFGRGGTNWSAQTRRTLERRAMVALAGLIAHGQAAGDLKPFKSSQTDPDRQEARKHLRFLVRSDDELSTHASWLWCRTETLLAEPANHAAVQALALALMESPTIGARKARSIIAEARESYKKGVE